MSDPAWGQQDIYEGGTQFTFPNFQTFNFTTGASTGQITCPQVVPAAATYFELHCLLGTSTGGNSCAGLVLGSYSGPNIRTNFTTTTGSVWVAENGAVFNNGVFTGTSLGNMTTGVALGVWINATQTQIAFTQNGTTWNGSFTTAQILAGTGVFAISFGAALVPFVSLRAAAYLTQPPIADPPGWGKPLPAGTDPTAATHSPGMPPAGALLGAQVGPNAIQTLYGAPIPYGWGQAVVFAQPGQQGAVMQQAMEARRTHLQELYSMPDWSQGVTQAAQEGWMDPKLASVVVNHPESRDKLLQTLVSPDSYFSTLEKYSGQGLRPDPQTGQMVVSPVAVQAAGMKAQSVAEGTGTGDLANAQALAYDRARGAAGAETQPLTVQATDADGRPQFQTDQQGRQVLGPDGKPIPILTQKIVNKGVLADQSGGSSQPGGAPSGGALTGLGAPGAYPPGAQPAPVRSVLSTPQMFPGSDLPPSDPRSATGAGPLLGGIPSAHDDQNAAPVPMTAAGQPVPWGQSPPNMAPRNALASIAPAAGPAATQPGGALAGLGAPGAHPAAAVPPAAAGGALSGLGAPQPAVRAPAVPPAAPSTASVPGLDTGLPVYTPPQTAALKVATCPSSNVLRQSVI